MNLAQEARKTQDFRLFLQQELVERCRKNPQYSLRAFAKSLGVVPSALSDMLNGRRTITAASIEKIGLALNLSLKEVERFKQSQGTSDEERFNLKFQQITMDSFAVISDWYHYAILELMKVDGFISSSAWISKALGISRSEANTAIERLVRLGLIEVRDDGSWADVSAGFSTNIEPGLTSSANRKLQKQILENAISAIDEGPLELRNNTSMTMAVNPEDIPEAVKKITSFRRGLCKFLERNGRPTEVYQLAIALYPAKKK